MSDDNLQLVWYLTLPLYGLFIISWLNTRTKQLELRTEVRERLTKFEKTLGEFGRRLKKVDPETERSEEELRKLRNLAHELEERAKSVIEQLES